MLNELQNLVPSEKEMKLQVFIHQLTNDLYNNEKIEVDSQRLLELLSYLTSNENISSQMKTATEFCNRNIVDILHKKEVDKLKNEIKYMEKNYIPKQKLKDKIEELKQKRKKEPQGTVRDFILVEEIKFLEELLEEK